MNMESMDNVGNKYLTWDSVSLALGKIVCAVKCWWNDYSSSSYVEVGGECNCTCYEKKLTIPMYHNPCPQLLHELEPKR